MNGIADFMRSFPLISVFAGMVIASAGFIYANRKVFSWQRTATEGLVNTLKNQIESLTTERNDYRTKLHDEREGHNSAVLRIKELEMRPDVGALFQASEKFYGEQTVVLGKLVTAFHDHDRAVSDRMKPVYDTLSKIGEGIQELLKRTPKGKR